METNQTVDLVQEGTNAPVGDDIALETLEALTVKQTEEDVGAEGLKEETETVH